MNRKGVRGVIDLCWVDFSTHFNVTFSRAMTLISVYSGYFYSVNTLPDLPASSGPPAFTVNNEGGRTQEQLVT